MASPFDRFRKNQKTWLAVFGVLLMISWVVYTPLTRGSREAMGNPIVVETKYGTYHARDLAMMKETRRIVEEFLKRIAVTEMQKFSGKQELSPQEEQMAGQFYTSMRNGLMGRRPQSPDGEAIETLVLSEKAKQLGMVVSNTTINQWLKQICAGSISDAELGQIIAGLSTNNYRVTQTRLFDAIRTEMLASKLLNMFETSMAGTTPAQRWDYFVRLNRRATVEVMPVPVASFVDQIKDPTQSELVEFFDKHKETLPNPDSHEPGFKIPKKAAFEYFKADREAMIAAASEKVTDAEIAAYYEEHKSEFKASELPTNEPAKEEPPTDSKTPAAENKDEVKKEATKPEEAKPAGGKPAGETKETPATPPADAPAKPASESTPEPEKKSSSIGRSPFQLVSLLQEERKDEAKPAEPGKAAEPAKPADAPAAAVKIDPAPAVESKPAEAAPSEPKKTDEAAPRTTDAPKEEPKPKYEPLEKVKDVIRKTLALNKADQQIAEAFDELESDMKNYSSERSQYLARREIDPDATAPEKLNFAALAKAKGLAAMETSLVTQAEIRDGSDIGKSFVRPPRGFPVPFVQSAFSDKFTIYKPETSSDDANNRYLYWKVEEAKETVPALEAVKTQVVLSWKMIQARGKALKQAEADAAKAQSEKKKLSELYGKDEPDTVKTVGPFSWMSMGDVAFNPMSNMPRLSEVPGVTRPGEAFMSAVFKLSPGQASAALNQPEDIAYVIQLVDYDKSLEEVEKEFAAADFRRYASVAQPDQMAMFTTWIENLEADARVQWTRQPTTQTVRDEE